MRTQTKKVIAVATVVVAVVVVALYLVLNGRGKDEKVPVVSKVKTERKAKHVTPSPSHVQTKNVPPKQEQVPKNHTGSVKHGKRKGSVKIASGAGDGIFRDSDGNPYPDADQKIMAAAEAAIENDDLAAARSLAEKALASDNTELKEMVVDALGWFGESAMAELTPFMSDANEEVAEAAASHWKDALQEMDDDGMKATVVDLTLSVIKNKDIVEDVANELIGIDEAAALKVLATAIESDNMLAADAARETYESITGEKWSGVDAAEKWLQENYTPPEDE